MSVVVAAFNMARELPRTIRSLSPQMQRDVAPGDYEIVVVDNGSRRPADLAGCGCEALDLRTIAIAPDAASPSPAQAVNLGLAAARGELVGVMIDGARMASPGLLACAERACRLHERAVVLTLGFHLGAETQMASIKQGYDQLAEDRLLEQVRWWEDGYRLFDVSVLASSSRDGWFRPIAESNAVFMPGPLWRELGGLDERFVSPGGGLVNHDLLSRAVALPDVNVVTILGEGTFHQVHGGVATNAVVDTEPFYEEYQALKGEPYRPASYCSSYLSGGPKPSGAGSAASAEIAAVQA